MISYEHNLDSSFFGIIDRQRNHQKGIELNWNIFALGTVQDGFVLSIHEVDDDRLISFQKLRPGFIRHHIIWKIVVILRLYVWFLLDSIQILMKSVKQKIDEFPRVMLVKPSKHRLVLSNSFFKLRRRVGGLIAKPHTLYQFAESSWQLSFRSQKILFVDVLNVFVLQEIVDKLFYMGNTLQSRIHETGVSEISQSSETFVRLLS